MEISTQVKPNTLKGELLNMKIGDKISYPIERRNSVRSTISYLKELSETVLFKTEKSNGKIIVERKS